MFDDILEKQSNDAYRPRKYEYNFTFRYPCLKNSNFNLNARIYGVSIRDVIQPRRSLG